MKLAPCITWGFKLYITTKANNLCFVRSSVRRHQRKLIAFFSFCQFSLWKCSSLFPAGLVCEPPDVLFISYRICFQGHKPRGAHVGSCQGEGLCGGCYTEKGSGECFFVQRVVTRACMRWRVQVKLLDAVVVTPVSFLSVLNRTSFSTPPQWPTSSESQITSDV